MLCCRGRCPHRPANYYFPLYPLATLSRGHLHFGQGAWCAAAEMGGGIKPRPAAMINGRAFILKERKKAPPAKLYAGGCFLFYILFQGFLPCEEHTQCVGAAMGRNNATRAGDVNFLEGVFCLNGGNHRID